MKKGISILVSIFLVCVWSVAVYGVTTIDLYVGETMQLTAELIGAEEGTADITWSSDQPSVASMNSKGLLTAKEPGSTRIRASYHAGTHIQEVSLQVTVKTTVRDVKLTPESLEMNVGETASVQATVFPVAGLTSTFHDGVSYRSSDKDIAIVDSKGVVKALQPGKAYILVEADDGGKTAYTEVHVASIVERIQWEMDQMDLLVAEEREVAPVFTPLESASTGYTLESLTPDVVEVKDGKLVGKQAGEGYVKAIATDGGKWDTLKVLVTGMVAGVRLEEDKVLLHDDQKQYTLHTELLWKTKVEPLEKGLEWETTDSSIVSVNSEGLLTGKKDGLAKITVTTVDGGFEDSCTVEVDLTDPEEPIKIYPKNIVLDPLPHKVYVGERIEITYSLFPENATENKVTLSSASGSSLEHKATESKAYYTAYNEGAYTISAKTVNGLVDSQVVLAKSTVEDIALKVDAFEQEYGKNILYLGQTGSLTYELTPKEGVPEIFLDSAEWKSSNNKVVKVNKDSGAYEVLGTGEVTIQVVADDSGVSDEAVFKVYPTAKAIEVPDKIVTGLNMGYTPPVTFTLEEDLKYGVDEVLDQEVELEIERYYVNRKFLEVEYAYEEAHIEALQKERERAKDPKPVLEQLQKARSRYYLLEQLLEEDDEMVPIHVNGQILMDRDGKRLETAAVKNDEVIGYFVGKVDLKVTSKDGAREAEMEVLFDDSVKTLAVYDETGALIGTSDVEAIAALKAAEEEKKRAQAEAERQALLGEYKALDPNDLPSTWALDYLKDARNSGILTQRIEQGFTGPISREIFAELAMQVYKKMTGEPAFTVPYGYFTDTDNQAVLQAYQLGIVNGVGDRQFAPERNVKRQEIAVMLENVLLAANVDVSGYEKEVSLSSRFMDGGKIAGWSESAFELLTGDLQVIGGYSDGRLGPEDSTTVEQAIAMCVKLLRALETIQ